ncbi:hypothetical protein MKW98_001960 [Papaver atlanticum]|uniref:GOLD domain-containing protein n=1 Tax=Papaver atlanticum TaxID=357466 RepID=A0AAD4SMJ8_9MAGN|nr:hypothetical protein MKW98_001960 [Papaver atlanticum]
MRIYGITVVIIGFLLYLYVLICNLVAQCIAEDIKANAVVVGKYSIINPSSFIPLPETHKITVPVTWNLVNYYHYGDQVETGQFSFTAPEADHKITVRVSKDSIKFRPFFFNDNFVVIPFYLCFIGVAAKDWPNVAKKGQIDVSHLLACISQNLLVVFLLFVRACSCFQWIMRPWRNKEQEEEMQGINRATNSKIAWLGFCSLFVCLSVAGLQLWHLKNFFERKKLL